MQFALKAVGIGGSLLVVIALVIALLKQVIAFIGFLTFAFKALIVLAFVIVFLGVGFIIYRSMSGKSEKDKK